MGAVMFPQPQKTPMHPATCPPNANRLLWAGFIAILAAGVGFSVRSGLLDAWATQFQFNGSQLGNINLGAGFISFCFGIIIGGVIVDRIGYGKLILAAFALHVVSTVVSFAAKPGMPTEQAYLLIYWGTFLFGLANGTLEAVANPLVATLFPHQRNHYLNLLHASWPLGMVCGGMIGWYFGGSLQWSWQAQLALYLIPTVAYGVMFLGQTFPKSEASSKGLKLGEMFKDVGILGGTVVATMLYFFLLRDVFTPLFPHTAAAAVACSLAISITFLLWIAITSKFAVGHWLLFLLFLIHAMVGSVELGTDGWIQNITGTLLTPDQGKILLVFTSLVMFVLRFCAHFIESRLGLKPVAILLGCSMLACLGLNLVAAISSFGAALGALFVYAIGKTFFWPTMLAIASDRFPRTGAIAISFMGGIGMMSAGLIGGPGLGYARDRFSVQELQQQHPDLAPAWLSTGKPSEFLGCEPVTPINPVKLGDAKKAATAKKAADAGDNSPATLALASSLTPAQQAVVAADVRGNRQTLRVDSLIPAAMAMCFAFLLLYFRSIGGYRPVTVDDGQPD